MNRPVSGDAALQDEVLENLSGAVNYRRWICDLARPWLGREPLEVGSGSGDYAAEWSAMGVPITASEAEPGRVVGLRRRFEDDPDVTVRELSFPSPAGGAYSAVVAVNVLEHIDRDVEALVSMRSMLRDDGHVVLFVPAFPLAMSRFDRQVGHFRRYRRRELADKLRMAGFEPVRLHHVNAPGLLAWLLLMRLGRGHPREGLPLRVFERLVPLLRRIEGWRRPPFGQSLFAVGVRRG